MTADRRRSVYWRRNLTYVAVLLAIWFAVSYGCGILLADELDGIRLGGFKLGFWFAQQGSIYVFVALIFVYVWLMNRLDRTLLTAAGDADDGGDGAPGGGAPETADASRADAQEDEP